MIEVGAYVEIRGVNQYWDGAKGIVTSHEGRWTRADVVTVHGIARKAAESHESFIRCETDDDYVNDLD